MPSLRVGRTVRPPDFVISADDPMQPYMLRWYLIPRNRWFNVYLHKIMRSDDERARHDHPWLNISVLLKGRYIEVVDGGWWKARRAGDVVFRRATTAHRLIVLPGEHVWSLFITGPKIREWGFHCANGWRHWTDFVQRAIGRGCD
ncbi:MAG: hypothetical protein KGL39_38140 [Patescibacteria group bacterium]|nr:hypothetical protein [Patescibacteria group bacterium]